ncbi:hypothetical protein [Pseudomonas piscis]|nr:hypothetical protein [Pseudomonas piscis]
MLSLVFALVGELFKVDSLAIVIIRPGNKKVSIQWLAMFLLLLIASGDKNYRLKIMPINGVFYLFSSLPKAVSATSVAGAMYRWSVLGLRPTLEGPFMSAKAEHAEPTNAELTQLKAKLKAGKLAPEDLKALVGLVERTEKAAKQLRAAIVE